MFEQIVLSLSAIAVLGISAQWIGWRYGVPSILLLLLFGIIAGPVSGLLDPDLLLGDLLYPVVSLAVAIIMFEGGLTLSIKEFQEVGTTVARLVSIGTAVTWVLVAGLAHTLLGLDWGLSVLLGAVLVVTGPTVIVPLLRHIRPSGQVGPILKWEGIVIDPIGATAAVLVYQVIVATESSVGSIIFEVLAKTLAIGLLLGLAGAWLLVQVLKRELAPDYLQNPVTVMVVIAAFTGANLLQHESGLLAVTIMGFALANQKQESIQHIIEFKESLRVMLIATIFILLAAHLKREDLAEIGLQAVAFLLILIAVIRPAAVFAATYGTSLSRQEKWFLALLAPRGIVAAAVSSIFALRLQASGYPGADFLVTITFFVIIGTVTIYGLSAAPLARRLGLAKSDPQGVLLLGGKTWVRELGKLLKDEGFPVLLVDNVRANVSAARLAGIPAFYASVFSDNILEQAELGGIGRLLAVGANDDVNSLAALHYAPIFGRTQIFQLASEERASALPEESTHARDDGARHLRGRTLFGEGVTHTLLTIRFISGWVFRKTRITEEFGFEDAKSHYEGDLIPMFTVADGKLGVINAQSKLKLSPGTLLISLVKPRSDG